MTAKTQTTVAIVGGGPGGLAAAIALSALPFVQVTLYEQNPEPREAGAGISLSTNAWRVLDLLGASDGVQGGSKSNTHQRNGYTGTVLSVVRQPENAAAHPRGAIRARRTRLQAALLARVPGGVIQFGKKLVALHDRGADGGVRLVFHDQTEASADLVVGADGQHSRVRRFLFPGQPLEFTGNVAWRVLVPKAALAHLPDVTASTAWWRGETGHVYFSDVDSEAETTEPLFEITARAYHEGGVPGETVPWGVPVPNDKVRSRFTKFDPRVRDALAVVPEGHWREFSQFAGPRLPSLTAWDKAILVGDASHPLAIGYGSGAAFAMEDGWLLARVLEHTQSSASPVRDAVRAFDEIRSAFYDRVYSYMEKNNEIAKLPETDSTDFDEILKARIAHFTRGDNRFIYDSNIVAVWQGYAAAHPQAGAEQR